MEYNAATVCDLCDKKFCQEGKNFVKVKYHCHYYTGKY